MGLFDGILGKRGAQDNIVLEPCKGGYTVKGVQAKTQKVSAVSAFFNGSETLKDERDVLLGLIKELDVAETLAPGAVISTAYETLPDIDEFVATQEMPDSLNTFLMSRAMMLGLARSRSEMARLAIEPFNYKGIKGVLILKEA